MLSKTSFFNKTLFIKNITRFWPVWAFYLLIWLFVMPAGLWSTMSSPSFGYAGADAAVQTLTSQVYHKGFIVGSNLTAVFGILAAMGVFSYLFFSRSASFYHALPVKREGLFFTNYLSGLSFLIVPVVVVFILTAVVESACGYLNLSALLSWLGIVTALTLFFYSFGVFCAMLTGSIIALPVFYCILNLVAYVLEVLTKIVLSTFVFGMTHNRRITLGFLSPYYQMNTMKTVVDDQISCWILIIGYAAAGIVFAGIALLLYRKRRVEAAGDVVAVRPARPIFKYGAAFCSALLLSFILHNTLGQASARESFWRMLICMLLSGFFGYYLAEMLLKKTLRVIKQGLRGWLVFSAVLIALIFSFKLDLYGYEKRIPDTAQVSRAYIANYINFASDGSTPNSYYGLRTEDTDTISQITGLHNSIISDRAALEGFNAFAIPASERDTRSATSVEVYYILKNGATMLRSYMLPVTEELLQDSDSPAARYLSITNDPDNILSRNFPGGLEKTDFQNSSLYPDAEPKYSAGSDTPMVQVIQNITMSQDQSYALYQAIVKDIKAGNIGKTYLLTGEEYKDRAYAYSVVLYFSGNFPEWRTPGNAPATTYSAWFQLETDSVNTVEALLKMGLVDESQLITKSGKLYKDVAKGLYPDVLGPSS